MIEVKKTKNGTYTIKGLNARHAGTLAVMLGARTGNDQLTDLFWALGGHPEVDAIWDRTSHLLMEYPDSIKEQINKVRRAAKC